MGLNRYDASRDANEPEIVKALQSVGFSVTRLSDPGVPDLLLGFRGVTCLAEVKAPDGKLTRDQEEWLAGWRGGEVPILRDVRDALRLANEMIFLRGAQ